MKRKIFLLLFVFLSVIRTYGQYSECLTGYPAVKTEYTPIQFSFWPLTIFHHDTDVYGIRLAPSVVHLQGVVWGCSIGGFIATGTHCGLSLSLCQTGYESYGIVGGVVNVYEKNNGLMLGIVNCCVPENGSSENFLQIGVFNSARNGLQIGLLNYNPKAFIPWMPLFSYSSPWSTQEELCK